MLEYIFKVLYEDSDDFDNFSSLKTYRDDFELSTMNGIGNDNSFFLPEQSFVASRIDYNNYDETQSLNTNSILVDQTTKNQNTQKQATSPLKAKSNLRKELNQTKLILTKYLEKFEEYEDQERLKSLISEKNYKASGGRLSTMTNSESKFSEKSKNSKKSSENDKVQGTDIPVQRVNKPLTTSECNSSRILFNIY